jgi:hypothetical protein
MLLHLRNITARVNPLWLLMTIALLLASCVSAPQITQLDQKSPILERLPVHAELQNVPFFAQDEHRGAPAALAQLLVQQGVATTPEQLTRQLRLPAQLPRLQRNIETLVNQQGLLLHPMRGNLPALLRQVADGNPVLVRFNRGVAGSIDSRYAVLIGYQIPEQRLIFRSGDKPRLEMSFADFLDAWSEEGHWAALVLSPEQLPASAAAPEPVAKATTAQEARESAAARTTELLGLYKRWQQAPTGQRASLREQMLVKAEQRRQRLLSMARHYPDEVQRYMIPVEQQRGMPAELVAKLEQPVELDGELEVLFVDYDDGQHQLRHLLKTAFGERFELRLAKAQRQWRSGLKVRVPGWLLESVEGPDDEIQGELLANEEELQVIEETNGAWPIGESPLEEELAYDLPNTKGAQRTLAILVNFQDAPTNKPWTTDQANSLIFGTVSDFMRENSAQQTWLSGAVAGWYTIPVNSTVCDGFAIEQQGKAAAQANGYVLGNYERFLLIFPQNSACGYSGMGQVGALPSTSWIHNSMILRTVAHELGHNLGLYHARAMDCGDTTLGSSCTTQEYGDTLDIMGYSGTVGNFHGFAKERLGWLLGGNLANVTSGGNFTLQPSSASTSAAKVLKIYKGVDASGKPSYYYVEFRRPVGFDARITDRGVVDPSNVFAGVTLRQASPSNANSVALLDLTPGSAFVDMKDAALVGGRSFNDPAAGLTLTTQWADANQTLVSVDLSGSGAPTCSRAAPTVSVSPAQSSWLPAGSSFSYSVNVTNRDSSACASSSFSLAPIRPSGWSASLGTSSLTLAAGASGSTSLNVTSPSGAANGFYSVGASASANNLSGSGSGSFVVDTPTTPANRAPQAVDDNSSLSVIAPVVVLVLVNDRDPDGDPLSIVAFTQGSRGKVSLNANNTLTYSPAKSFKTSDQFSYTISDGKLTSSATVSIRKP